MDNVFSTASMKETNRGVHRFRIGPDRLDLGPKICLMVDRGPDRFGVGPGSDQTGPDREQNNMTVTENRRCSRGGKK